MEKIFVYGTLRRGECNHNLITDTNCLAMAARINGCLMDTGFGYPGLLKEAGEVIGELYEITEEHLMRLDALEGYLGPGDARNLYNRIKIEVNTDREIVMAWTYFYDRESDERSLLKFSDWKVYQMEKSNIFPYFAYGSCMDIQRIEDAGFIDDFRDVIGRGTLNGFNLQFTKHNSDGGRADIVESGGHVQGKLYRLPMVVIIEYLYGREGVGRKVYRPIIVPLIQQDGQRIEALTFVVMDKQTELAPPNWYMDEILRGAEPIVSSDYYRALKERFVSCFQYENGERDI